MTARKTYRKLITKPEIKEQINPENLQLMNKFLKNFSTKNSPNSVVNYRSNLYIFFCWNVMENENKFIVDIKKFELMEFFDYCVTELRWSSNRFAQMHSCLSSFCTWIENMYDEKYPTFRNLLPKIEKPVKETIRKKSVFTKQELDNLLDWLGQKGRVNEQCLLATMMATGARMSELSRFTVSMIDENNTVFDGLFLETTEEMRVKGRGVNGKKIVRYIIKDLFLPYYHKWLPVRESIMKENNQNHDYLFVTKTGTPATTATFKGWIEKWDEVLTEHMYVHSLRHWWCTFLLSIGLERELVQEMQDWQSDSILNIYNDSTIKDRKWKGLDKLKIALGNDLNNEENKNEL